MGTFVTVRPRPIGALSEASWVARPRSETA